MNRGGVKNYNYGMGGGQQIWGMWGEGGQQLGFLGLLLVFSVSYFPLIYVRSSLVSGNRPDESFFITHTPA